MSVYLLLEQFDTMKIIISGLWKLTIIIDLVVSFLLKAVFSLEMVHLF